MEFSGSSSASSSPAPRDRFSSTSTSSSSDSTSSSWQSSDDDGELQRRCRWLSSLPSDEVRVLRYTREYSDILKAFEALAQAHRHAAVAWSNDQEEHGDDDNENDDMMLVENSNGTAAASAAATTTRRRRALLPRLSFLQHKVDDDILLRVLDFLESQSLVRATATCSRFRDLAERSARRRSANMARERQLANPMQLLRAAEQMDGIGVDGPRSRHVRIPTLLLSRRVLIQGCGDAEFNGYYYCTGSNGNGFVFTKPRSPELRVRRPPQPQQPATPTSPASTTSNHNNRRAAFPDEAFLDSRLESEVAQPGQLLRCIIAKRFSNEVRSDLKQLLRQVPSSILTRVFQILF